MRALVALGKPMHTTPSERRTALIKLVQTITDESGTYEPFNAETWVDTWLNATGPFRNGRPLRDLLKDDEGFDWLATRLRQHQAGIFD